MEEIKMSCYLRHMEDIFRDAGIEITKENRKDIDEAIHKIVDIDYKNCPEAWKKIKDITKGDDENKKVEFIRRIKEEAEALIKIRSAFKKSGLREEELLNHQEKIRHE